MCVLREGVRVRLSVRVCVLFLYFSNKGFSIFSFSLRAVAALAAAAAAVVVTAHHCEPKFLQENISCVEKTSNLRQFINISDT